MSNTSTTTNKSEFYLANFTGKFNASTVRKTRHSRSWHYDITFTEEDYKNSRFRKVVNVVEDKDSIDGVMRKSLLTIDLPGGNPNHMCSNPNMGSSIIHNGRSYSNCHMPIALLYTGKRLSEVDHDQLRAQILELKQRLVRRPSRMDDGVTDEDLVNYFENYVGFERDVLSISLRPPGSSGQERTWVFNWWCRGECPDPAFTLYIQYTPSFIPGGAGYHSPYLLS
jgi:hypothetical protein